MAILLDINLINDYVEEKMCEYKGESYSVRDNGAVYRHLRNKLRPRKYDAYWTFGVKNKQGCMCIGEHRVHIIVATAFYGENDSKKYVVDHIDTNRCNNRVENLRWLTRLENALNNPITLKKITYWCGGDIQKFLDNPSCLKDTAGNNQDILWMRTVSYDEAKVAYKNIMRWANDLNKQPRGNTNKSNIGEWIFKDSYKPLQENYRQKNKNIFNHIANTNTDLIIESLTPNALQKNWKTPTQFVLCPSEMLENPLESYLHNIAKKIIIATNQYTSCVVMDFALYDNKILVVTQDIHINAIKPYGLLTITIYGDKFLHEISTFFEQKGAEKVFTLSQGLEWIGGDGIDDYC